MPKIAIILGATGLTGGLLLEKLVKDNRYDKIKLFSRSAIDNNHPKIEEHLIDMLALHKHAEDFIADEVFCCIGTTNAKTPDKKFYHKVDYGIPVTAAQLCKTNAIDTFIVISALGANPNSSVFYNRTKGEMEETVLEFDIIKTHILQPSLINSKRKERRIGEYIFILLMNLVNPVLVGRLKKYRSITPKSIVSAMVWLANHEYSKKRILSDEISKIGNKG